MSMSRSLPLAIGIFMAGSLAAGQQPHGHRHADQQPGGVHLPIDCRPEVQPGFDQAVAALHSFGYEEARRGFLAVAEQDPDCGMAWWGVAMTYFHQQWDQPTPAELDSGRVAAEKALEIGGKNDRENAYIAAIGAFYRDSDRLDHPTRARAYRDAMKKLATEFPEDDEASIFYALSLLATRQPDDTTYTSQKQAADILNRLLSEHPEHPGIAHYTIHAFDYPELAEHALPAARVYARLAPDAPHALHMPSHIFTRLGLWDESIASNLEVARVAKEQMARTNPGAVAFENLHALDYLAYAYLQMGNDPKAKEVVDEVASARRFDVPNFAVGYSVTAVPARYALERRDWQAAASLKLPDIDLPWENYAYAQGNTYYANAIGSARLGNVAEARTALQEIEKMQKALAEQPARGPYDWAAHLEAMRLAGAGWIAYAEGREEEAVRLLTEAAELEERVGKHPVTPGPLLPAREQLGDMLLELGRPSQALAAYEATLADSPRRFNSLAGAARAAELAGDQARSQEYTEKLLTLCRAPDCQRDVERWIEASGTPR